MERPVYRVAISTAFDGKTTWFKQEYKSLLAERYARKCYLSAINRMTKANCNADANLYKDNELIAHVIVFEV